MTADARDVFGRQRHGSRSDHIAAHVTALARDCVDQRVIRASNRSTRGVDGGDHDAMGLRFPRDGFRFEMAGGAVHFQMGIPGRHVLGEVAVTRLTCGRDGLLVWRTSDGGVTSRARDERVPRFGEIRFVHLQRDRLAVDLAHRIRVGVESREDKNIPPTEAFVLQNFTDEEIKKLQVDVFPKIKLEIEKFIGN